MKPVQTSSQPAAQQGATAVSLAERWAQMTRAWGFLPSLGFALRTALAAFVALAIAYALGLEHPHWAAMSVWAASQPMREHLLSRGMYRFGGSVVGVLFAVLLVTLAQGNLWVLAMGLALWVGLCAFTGNLQRGYMVYGCLLSGYSAAMVVLLHHGPAHDILDLAWDRVWTVITGVLTALCISWCFAPRRQASVLIGQSRQALAGVLQSTAARLRGLPTPEGLDNPRLLSQLAVIEELLEVYPEGSRTARAMVRSMRWQQHRALELVYHLGQTESAVAQAAGLKTSQGDTTHAHVWTLAHASEAPVAAALADALDRACEVLRANPQRHSADQQPLDQALRQATVACEALVEQVQASQRRAQPGIYALHQLLEEMRRALRAELRDLRWGKGAAQAAQLPLEPRQDPVPLHRDWVGAREAGLRAGGTMVLLGAVWAATGWSLVGFGMLGLSVMLLVFSAFESPHRTMRFVLRGQIIGASLALLCQIVVWPWAGSGWQMVALALPFAVVGGLVFAHRRTAVGAMDTNMVMFILLAPVFPAPVEHGHQVSMALAVVSGPALAWIIYRLVFRTNAERRMRTLARMMVAEVPALAQRLVDEGQPSLWASLPLSMTPAAPGFWQAQLHHRMLKLVRWADKTGFAHKQQLPALGMALRAMPSAMLQLQQWRRDTMLVTPGLRRTDRMASLVLHRTAQWGQVDDAQALLPKVIAAWQQLAAQPELPPLLAAQLLRVAERDWPALERSRRNLLAQV